MTLVHLKSFISVITNHIMTLDFKNILLQHFKLKKYEFSLKIDIVTTDLTKVDFAKVQEKY